MKILHISAECYPAAKAGGLGDVVGALPKYLNAAGSQVGVIIPKYQTKWMEEHSFSIVYKGVVRLGHTFVPFSIEKENSDALEFPFFVANIPGKFDRAGIYTDAAGNGFRDDVERYLCFQQAVLQWILNAPGKPQVLHCHDHHTGLIPFFLKHAVEYKALRQIPTIFTIHNGKYHGAYSWDKMYLLPFFDGQARGLLDWNQLINPLATAIKCAWRVTTVSPTYLKELRQASNGLELLLQHEQHKCLGILNGIDTETWDPESDPMIVSTKGENDLSIFKDTNKKALLQRFNLNQNGPLIVFIGRLVAEKGADLIPDLLHNCFQHGMRFNFILLGTGQANLHRIFEDLNRQFANRFHAVLEYNESLAHQLYAGADFMFMPSRVEPCGLNQMYAMRYGTIPIVRAVGGLHDTVPDIGERDGRGIRFHQFNLEDSQLALYRAAELFHRFPENFEEIRAKITNLDFSWERSVQAYSEIYEEMRSV